MSVFQAIFLGIVQGLTEFLPVSSSGHLAIFQNLFHIDTGGSVAFDVMLHVGTLVVVFLVYWKDICKLVIEACKMLADLFVNLKMAVTPNNTESPRQYRRIIRTNYRKFVVLVIVSTIPTGGCVRHPAGSRDLPAHYRRDPLSVRPGGELLEDPEGCFLGRRRADRNCTGVRDLAGDLPIRNHHRGMHLLRF